MKIRNRVWGHKSAKRGVIVSIFVILVLTFLEMPKPLGFETRPQDNVSKSWLILFFVILAVEILAMIRIQRHAKMSARMAIIAAVLNIFQVYADQTHMMQPQVPSHTYTLIEYAVVLVSLGLIYFSLGVLGYLRKM